MTRYWMLGLIGAIVALVYLGWRRWKASEPLKKVDLPLWETEQYGHLELKSEDVEDDTAPAVLSPPDWKPPNSTSSGSRR